MQGRDTRLRRRTTTAEARPAADGRCRELRSPYGFVFCVDKTYATEGLETCMQFKLVQPDGIAAATDRSESFGPQLQPPIERGKL